MKERWECGIGHACTPPRELGSDLMMNTLLSQTINHYDDSAMDCRPGCGACCIALSISTPIPGMPLGKPAGVRCVQLTDDLRCAIFTDPQRPSCCAGLKPSLEMCGNKQSEALTYLDWLEEATRP